ncbi:unnamed protein product [Coregonus sp. 'balchen']|nr:unnamed protein product [Coregonus sp. 'balchen']
MLSSDASTSIIFRKFTFSSVLLPSPLKDERLTVTRAAPVNGTPAILHFHYQLSERRAACWETALSSDSLFLEIAAGALAEGSKEGLTSLLEFAEEKLNVNYVLLWFDRAREDRCKCSTI